MSVKKNKSPALAGPGTGGLEKNLPLKAEKAMKKKQAVCGPGVPDTIQQQLHDLEVYKAELEMQNEELRRTQIELETSQQRYIELYDHAPIGYCTISKKGIVLKANVMAAALLGIDRNSLVNQPLSRYVIPDDADSYYFNQKKLFETGEPQVYKLRMRKHGADFFWARLDVNLAYDSDTHVPVCRAVLSDITAAKQDELRLQQSEYRQRALLDNIPDIAWLKDVDGIYIAANDAYARWVGHGNEDLEGKTDYDLWPRNVAEKFIADDLKVMQAGQGTLIEEPVTGRDGTHHFFETIKSPFFDSSGIVAGTVGISRDVTERAQAAEELRMASQNWRDTFDAMLDPVALLGVDHTIQKCNRAFAEFTGLGFEEILGQKCYALVHKTEEPPPKCPVLKSLKTGMRETWQMQLGEKYYFIVSDPVNDKNGALVGIVHIIRDVTSRVLAEDELRRANLDFQTILDAIPAFVWVGLEPECRVIIGNRYVNDYLGVPAGTNLSQSAPAGDAALAVPHRRADGTLYLPCELPMQRAVATGEKILNEEFEYCVPDGRRCWVVGNAVPLLNDDGLPRGSVAAFININSLKKAQQELQDYVRLQTALLAAIPDIIVQVDTAKMYVWANDAAREFFGSDVVGHEAAFYFAGEQTTYSQVNSIFNGDEKTLYIESWQYRCDGQKRLLGWWCHVLKDIAGNVTGAVSSARDITDVRRLEAQLRDTNDELERFLYSVSHDLKSPLVTIRSFVGHLVEDVGRGDHNAVEQDLGFIDNAAQQMDSLLEELLQLSRLGSLSGTPVETSFQVLAHDAEMLVAGQLVKRGVRVLIHDTPVMLYGDRARLVEIFQNLLDNAVKYIGDQAQPLITMGAELSNGNTLVYVRDNGIGIDPGHCNDLFNVFKKADPNSPGVGMGLALVRRIVELHGGRIWCESEGPGKGACFWFTLPQKQVQS